MENPSGAVHGNSQNNPTNFVPRSRSTFPLMYHFFGTQRFAEYTPHFVMDSVKQDTLPVRSSHKVMSYTLKAPLMQDITMVKDYFSVPMEAILPLNWTKFFVNPVRGDDVTSDVGHTVESFWKKVGQFISPLFTRLGVILSDASTTDAVAIQATIRCLILGEYFYSHGSLMAYLGCHGAPYCTLTTSAGEISWDTMFDDFLGTIASDMSQGDYFTLVADGETYYVGIKGFSYGLQTIDLHHALSLMRDDPTAYVSAYSGSGLASGLLGVYQKYSLSTPSAEVPFNTSRLWAYQLVCAHYYTNDHVDYVYSAELFRQLIGNYISQLSQSTYYSTTQYFTYNGVQYLYDYLSAFNVSNLLAYCKSVSQGLLTVSSGIGANDVRYRCALGFLSALFAFRRSLRYQDYFTGSRVAPLAVGSTGVTVVNNTVDVVDVTRNIQKQRFLNAVNRVRHDFEGYLKDIFGGDLPAPDYHNPFFLCSTSDTVFGDETANTGAAQMQDNIAITTNLRSNGSRYMFEIRSDRPDIILGLTHYDLPRVYSKSIERSFFHVDRFDMFNPFMQYIGDQPLYINELGIKPVGAATQLNALNYFSFTLRHMEYKQRYNQCAGGFVENLPGWIFIASDVRGGQVHLNPDWIRSVNSEFDSFFVSLTGYSNGSYFHFIVDNYNDCTGSRPMAYAPSIL